MNFTNPTQHWQITKLGSTSYTNRWIILDWDGTDGKFYDSDGAGTPFLTITGCKYADVINTYGRVYISPLTDIGTPLDDASNGFIWLYDGTTARLSGGIAADLTTGPTAVVDTILPGYGTPGQHLFAVLFETDTGFLTPPPDPSTWINFTTAGSVLVQMNDIPLGPTECVARIIIATRTIVTYDGIPENWEMFQAYRIPDNTTTFQAWDLIDSGLVDSVDYLLDIYDRIPACNRISVYGSRLMYNGPHTDPSLVIVSRPSDPETSSKGEDYLQKPDGSPEDIYVGRELRDVYYIFKENSTWATRENPDQAVNAWPIELIDSGIGCSPFGIGEVMANTGSLILDNFLVVGLTGAYIFSGTYSKEPISRNIQPAFTCRTYTSRSKTKYLRLVIDPVRRLFFILLPLINDDPALNTAVLYVGNYFNGLSPDTIKWATWDEGVTIINSIQVYPSPEQLYFPCLTIVYPQATGVHYELLQGNSNAIPAPSWSYVTGYNTNPEGALYTFATVRVRALGIPLSGDEPPATPAVLNIGYGALDSLSIVTTEQLTIVAKPGKFYTSLLNVVGEKIRISLSGNFYFMISKLVLFVSERAKDRQR
jgi:hypothetical protein